jgi:hypothetical protein
MYSLAQFANISPSNLPINVKQTILQLCKQLGTDIPFTMIQETTGIKDSLRELNKITKENKEEKSLLICSILQNHESELEEFLPILFKELCKQPFFSPLYADLFYLFQSKWPIFHTVFNDFFMIHKESLATIQTCSPDEYDEYCSLKKINDERRAFTLFLVNCIKNKSVDILYYDALMNTLVQCITNALGTLGSSHDIMNEYIEHLFILIQIKEHSIVDTLLHSDISMKMKFRCMDIINLHKSFQ